MLFSLIWKQHPFIKRPALVCLRFFISRPILRQLPTHPYESQCPTPLASAAPLHNAVQQPPPCSTKKRCFCSKHTLLAKLPSMSLHDTAFCVGGPPSYVCRRSPVRLRNLRTIYCTNSLPGSLHLDSTCFLLSSCWLRLLFSAFGNHVTHSAIAIFNSAESAFDALLYISARKRSSIPIWTCYKKISGHLQRFALNAVPRNTQYAEIIFRPYGWYLGATSACHDEQITCWSLSSSTSFESFGAA